MTRTCAVLLLAVALSTVATAETLGSVLRSRLVPTNQFSDSDLAQPIAGWSASNDEDPFLLAYYVVDLSWDPLRPVRGAISLGPLHVIRYDPATRDLRRAEFPKVPARLSFDETISCLLPVLTIGEQHGVIHIETHVTPSAVCLLLLSPQLTLRTTLYGGLLGMVGADYAIVQRNEIHFAAVHPMRIAVYDLRSGRPTEVYPPAQDAYRQQFSQALQSHMPSQDWCRTENTPCDPRNFDADVMGEVAVNESVNVFGFVARFEAEGFGQEAARQVQPLEVAYIYRHCDDRWEHREFLPARLMDLFGVETVGELVTRKPHAVFETLKAPPETPARPARSRPGSLP